MRRASFDEALASSVIMKRASKAKLLRELIAKGAVMMPGVPNASMARQVEQSEAI